MTTEKIRRGEEEADNFFRADALAQGYIAEDAHEPGNGRGLWAYYADHGMVPPQKLDREIPKRELTGFDRVGGTEATPLNLGGGAVAVEQDGQTPFAFYGRHTRRLDPDISRHAWSDGTD